MTILLFINWLKQLYPSSYAVCKMHIFCSLSTTERHSLLSTKVGLNNCRPFGLSYFGPNHLANISQIHFWVFCFYSIITNLLTSTNFDFIVIISRSYCLFYDAKLCLLETGEFWLQFQFLFELRTHIEVLRNELYSTTKLLPCTKYACH